MASVAEAVRLLTGRRTLVLTGAGVSTDSGIPDYRGPDSHPRTPMTIAEFRSGPPARRRYWARSYVGWRAMGRAVPNPGHLAIAELEASGPVFAVITQNVDGLHSAAGSGRVVDLHGRISDVRCLDCDQVTPRSDLQDRLKDLNPNFADRATEFAPDGDAVVAVSVDGFRVAECASCRGVLKPDVVFFGENVPRERVQQCTALVDRAEAVLVAGSSLTVLSGFRFVRQAHSAGIAVVIVNRGPTRADDLATVRLDSGCSEILAALNVGLAAATAHPQVAGSSPSR